MCITVRPMYDTTTKAATDSGEVQRLDLSPLVHVFVVFFASVERREDSRVRSGERQGDAGRPQRPQHGCDSHRRRQGLQKDRERRGRGTGEARQAGKTGVRHLVTAITPYHTMH